MSKVLSGRSATTQSMGTGPMADENIITGIAFTPEPTRSNFVSYVGRKFSRLTVIGYAGIVKTNRKWWCQCECGSIKKAQSSDLRSEKVKSCGCLNSEIVVKRNTKHGMSSRPEYAVWCSIIDRCENPNSRFFFNYGGRGIHIQPEWRASFERFFSDMGPRPTKDMTVERRDTNGPYSKENCYWSDRQTNNNNKRNNRLLTARGMTLTMADWSRIVSTNYSTIRSRKRLGYSDEQALFGL